MHKLSANTASDYQLKCGMLNDMLDIIDVENKCVSCRWSVEHAVAASLSLTRSAYLSTANLAARITSAASIWCTATAFSRRARAACTLRTSAPTSSARRRGRPRETPKRRHLMQSYEQNTLATFVLTTYMVCIALYTRIREHTTTRQAQHSQSIAAHRRSCSLSTLVATSSSASRREGPARELLKTPICSSTTAACRRRRVHQHGTHRSPVPVVRRPSSALYLLHTRRRRPA